MRCIASLVVACLLLAGAAPRRAVEMHPEPRENDAMVSAKAVVALGARREPVRHVGKLALDPVALPSSRVLDRPPPAAIDVARTAPRALALVEIRRATARGPPG